MTNKDIARTLREAAALIELTGGNAFRARAFSGAARTVSRLDDPVAEHVEAGTLTELEGVGRSMAAHITDISRRGSFDLRDELVSAVPVGLLEMLRVQGLGTTRVRRLWKELGITSVDELEQAAAAGRLAALSGFGEKTQANVLANVRLLKRYRARRRYAEAYHEVQPLLDHLRGLEGVRRAEPAGALRRALETVGRADLAAAGSADAVQAALQAWFPDGALHSDSDDLVFEGALPDGLPLRVTVVPAERFGTAWWRLTGSDAHCRAFQDTYGTPQVHAEEHALYAAAGLPFIAPELREGRGELEAAAAGALPDLITTGDLRGTLHNHSTYSDGAHTLRQMAEAARRMGLAYFGICDHSRSLAVANGLSIARVKAQQEEVRALNEEFAGDGGPPFRIFSGTESDILRDGALDYPDEVLASFDFVVASIHSGLNMTEEEATTRVLRAVENPYTTILGHATGRLLLAREGYPLDHERIIEACARHGVAIELNANPYRLDMDWRYLRRATRRGVLISINPDAHATGELHYVRWGVAAARKGWLTPAQCLNARSLDDFAAWLQARRSTPAA